LQHAPSSKTRRPAIRWSYGLTVVAAIAAVCLLGIARNAFAPDLNNLVFDLYQRIDQAAWTPEAPVRIVDIDDESIARLGQWPWPRSTMAEIIARLGRLNAAAIAVDAVFAEPDGSSLERTIAMFPASPGRTLLEKEIAARTSNDALLAQTIANVPTVLGAILVENGTVEDFPTKFGIATAGDDPRPFLAHFNGAVLPLASLRAAAAGVGALNWLPDRDQVVRRVPLVAVVGDKIVPSLAIEALRLSEGASTIIVRSSNASGHTAFGDSTGVNTIKVGAIEIPTDPQGALRVNYSRSEPRRFIPAWKLLAGDVAAEEIVNRIIVVGTSAAGLRDQRATPVDVAVAGVEIHAQVIEQIASAAWLRRPDWAPGAELILAGALALAFGLMLPRTGALSGAIAAVIAVCLVAWASRYGFTAHGLLLDPVLPGLAIIAAYVPCVVWLYRAEQRRRKLTHAAFGRYVSPAIVERLVEDPSRLVLGGELRPLTVMFCDVRGFTSIAERLDPQGLTAFMNEYLTSMTNVILSHAGTVDKYIGDAIMAFWNAPVDDPDHARNAVDTAMAMNRELTLLNHTWAERARLEGTEHHEIGFRIGLATGECCVGNFGSSHRFDYSVLGDDVNLASRLELANKFYGTIMLASEATCALLPDMPWLEVDHVRVRGKSQVSRIFTLADSDVTRDGVAFAGLSAVHERMLSAYRDGDFAAAAAHAREARGLATPWLHDLYTCYERRCCELRRARADDWTPILDLEKI
jgi:adenylate cyclase